MSRPPILTATFNRLFVGHMLQALGYSSMLLLPLYVTALGANRETVGHVMAAAAIGGLVFRPVAGWALDHLGRKITLTGGTIVLVVGMALIGVTTEVGPLLYLSRVLVGVGVGTLFTGYFAFAADIIPVSRRVEGIAIFGVSGLIPLALNPVARDLAGANPLSLRWVYPVLAVLIGLSFFAIAPLKEPKRTPEPATGAPKGRLRTLFAKPLIPVWVATIGFSGLVAVFMAFATVAAQDRGVSRPADLWFTYALVAVLSRVVGPGLPERVGPRNIVAPAMFAYALAALLVASAETDWSFRLAGGLAGLGHGYCFPVLTGQVVDRIPSARRGSGLAVFTALWEITALVLAPLAGRLADQLDDRVLFASIAVATAGALLVWLVLEQRWGRVAAPTAEHT